MKRFSILSLALLPLVACVAAATQELPTPYALWADDQGTHINAHGGGLLHHNGRYYWYGEHKVAGDAGNYAEVGVHCYSSENLRDWKDEGIALAVEEDEASPIARGCILERPKVIHCARTGQFVMWFHLELKGQDYSAAWSGCAVADSPTGPFRFLHAGRVNAGHWPMNLPEAERRVDLSPVIPQLTRSAYSAGDDRKAFLRRDMEGGQMARDMTLFVDDDGTAWHIYSSEENSTLHIAELTPDYTAHTGRYIRLFEGGFNEAPAICKRGGKYYLICSGCTGWMPNAARAYVADKLLGEWKPLGNPCVGTGAEFTFGAQSTCIQKVEGAAGEYYLFMADAWRPLDAQDGRYLWLPLEFTPEGGLKLTLPPGMEGAYEEQLQAHPYLWKALQKKAGQGK